MLTQQDDLDKLGKVMIKARMLDTIIEYGLMIRQIPLKIRHTMEMRHHKEGNEIVENKYPSPLSAIKRLRLNPEDYRVDGDVIYRRFTRYYTIPKHAGWWMCQPSVDTMCRVEWQYKECNLAPTLEESILLYVNKKEAN